MFDTSLIWAVVIVFLAVVIIRKAVIIVRQGYEYTIERFRQVPGDFQSGIPPDPAFRQPRRAPGQHDGARAGCSLTGGYLKGQRGH